MKRKVLVCIMFIGSSLYGGGEAQYAIAQRNHLHFSKEACALGMVSAATLVTGIQMVEPAKRVIPLLTLGSLQMVGAGFRAAHKREMLYFASYLVGAASAVCAVSLAKLYSEE